MAVTPPYSIIDTIARLRAQGGAAWGDAAANVGKSIGGGIEQMGANSRAKQKDVADRHHDLLMTLDKTGTFEHAPPDTGAPQPQAGAGPAGAASPIIGGAGAPPAPKPAASQQQALRVSDLQQLAGLPPTSDAAHMIWRPNASREQLQQEREQATQTQLETKEAAASKAAHEKYFTPVDDAVRAQAKKAGIPLGAEEKEISNQTYDAIKKGTASKDKSEAADKATAAKSAATKEAGAIRERIASAANGSKEQIKAMADRDAFLTKNPTMSAIFGTPKDLGKPVGGEGKPAAAGRINMIDKNGKPVNVRADQVDEAIKQGFTKA